MQGQVWTWPSDGNWLAKEDGCVLIRSTWGCLSRKVTGLPLSLPLKASPNDCANLNSNLFNSDLGI